MRLPPISAEDLPGPWTHQFVVVNGVRLHYVEAGNGPLLILLHGFPEFWYCWRHQIPFLAQQGFRVVAPDQRGYNLSDKPRDVASYHVDTLAADIAALIRHLGSERATVVGHDWGGVVAWFLAMTRPECVERLAILNAPHPAAFNRERRKLAQLLKSWYIFFFQLPLLPELLCRWHRFAMLCRSLRDDPGGTHPRVSEQELGIYRLALSRPGALTGAINWYRAMMRSNLRGGMTIRPISMPALVLWGERDRYLERSLLHGLDTWVPHVEVRRFPQASHWLQVDEREAVNQALAGFASH
jgi:pimeloyl-ACP methyl ester carboxylesterase